MKHKHYNIDYEYMRNIKYYDKYCIKNTLKHEKSKSFNPKNLKVKKSIILNCPIFSVKYSNFNTNILAACDEQGFLTIIDTNKQKKHPIHNNTLIYNEIEPIVKTQIQDNTIFDIDWCFSDTKIITATGTSKCIIYNIEKNLNETVFTGHTKSVKCVKQAFFNDNLFSSCGRDGLILLWDVREKRNEISNPIGGFKSINKNSLIIKKKNSINNLENSNSTFTGICYYNEYLLMSIESNEDDIKFWDLRKPFTKEELDVLNSKVPTRIMKSHMAKMEDKTYTSLMNQYSAIFTRFNEIQEKMKMSSKHNTSNNLLFSNHSEKIFSELNFLTNDSKYDESYNRLINSENDEFSFFDSKKKRKSFNQEGTNSNLSTFSMNKDLEEEQFLSEKIKEIKSKKNRIKGLTSIHINREFSRILVNSMSHSQYVYDPLFYEKYSPLELKGHTSSFFVKSVLSPYSDFVLSGSNDAVIYIWSLDGFKNSLPEYDKVIEGVVKLSGFHKSEINTVSWCRNNECFIASASDDGVILLWDDK